MVPIGGVVHDGVTGPDMAGVPVNIGLVGGKCSDRGDCMRACICCSVWCIGSKLYGFPPGATPRPIPAIS